MRLPSKNVPRWMIFVVDLAIAFLALIVAYVVRFDAANIPIEEEYDIFITGVPIYLATRGVLFLAFKMHSGMIRHTAIADVKRVIFSTSIGTLLLVAISFIKFRTFDNEFLFPSSVIIVEYFVCISFLLVFRFAVKLLYMEGLKRDKDQITTIIYGAGTYGLITKHTIEKESKLAGKIIAFIDDDKSKMGKSMEGLKIYHTKSLEKVITTHNVKRLIVSIKEADKGNKRFVINTCLANNVEILNVPLPTEWINGEFTTGQIKPVKIDDLLGRESIKLESEKLGDEFRDKVILVTGAAGSIGSEIVRQLTAYNPTKVVMLDQAESPLYNLEMELKEKGVSYLTESVIADIRNIQRIENVFSSFKPDIVFHAAAYKHVPMMEDNPSEAILTNVQGTKNLVDLSSSFKVEKFVLISTDKAVNPTNVMGCSKRIAEIYAQSANTSSGTKFITTRFGNVLGSNGSVIPLFKRQIEAGGPLTVTHKEITRFFMTIPEAVALVLEAEAMGDGSEIFVFDMGESVKIFDLAKKMIKLSGLEEGKDIEIKITGLRPGEKLYEELLTNEENTMPTHHPQILIAKVREYDFEDVSSQIAELAVLFEYQNNEDIVKFMKWLVPEFRSNNSEFEKLDK
jgi:FlaA1/EpsC-like NDP-sugar epimerase